MRAIGTSLRRFRRASDGVAAVELTLVAPILLVSMLAAADLGRFALERTWVTYASSAGAEYAAAHGYNSDKVSTAAASASPVSGVSTSSSQYYGCATSSGVTVSTYGAICPSTLATSGAYVSVTSSMSFTPIFSALGINYPSTVSGAAIVRIQ